MVKRFLVIDDEPAIGRLVGRIAEACGCEVQVTTEAEAFKDAVITWDPAILALDLAMPSVDGVELLRFLASVKSEARVLIMSGFDSRVLETAARMGSALGLEIAAAMTKPIRASELRSAILSEPQIKR